MAVLVSGVARLLEEDLVQRRLLTLSGVASHLRTHQAEFGLGTIVVADGGLSTGLEGEDTATSLDESLLGTEGGLDLVVEQH